MIYRINKRTEKENVLELFDPIIRKWFNSRFDRMTEPQEYAIPYIHSGKNVLVSAPTGSGKTLTAFLTVINELFLLAKENKLENRIYCIYISPLKALANDIHRNLTVPLEEIERIAESEGIQIPKIRHMVRSGDTTQAQRSKMTRTPPHIIITTPESLGLMLSSSKMRENLKNVRYVIVDEIHELSSSKRGVMLSLNLERLQNYSKNIIRIGLSATQAPIEEMAKLLSGFDDSGDLRDVYILEVDSKKSLDLNVISPVQDLFSTPFEIINERMYDIIEELIKTHRTTLIFTNTRSGTEHVSYKLRERGIESLEAHHSSLGKDTRLKVEEMLKNGQLKCVISSTSLELGIDIGYIDLVVQIGSPKSIAKGLQRIGRSGHAYGSVSKGRMIVLEMDDLIECAVLTHQAYRGKIDRVNIPKNSLDVLAQVLVGMSLEDVWNVEDAYRLVKKSYCYSELPSEKFMQVINYLSGKTYGDLIYSKIWYDDQTGKFGKKKSTKMIYFMNMGTIPDEANFHVVDDTNSWLGELSEKFVEKLRPGDIFVLGGRTYEYLYSRGSKVHVKRAEGRRPTVPSWVGEMLPRSFDLSIEVGKFRKRIMEMIKNNEDVVSYLMDEYHLDRGSSLSIYKYIKEQMIDHVPTDRSLMVEGYIDPSNMYNIIFHFPYGRRVNDALSRAYAYRIASKYSVGTRITVTDDAFMITVQKRIPLEDVISMVKPSSFVKDLRSAIFNSELFKQRFRHCAARSFMILKKYKGQDISVTRQQLKSDRLLQMLSDIPDFPVIEETFNEIFTITMDVPHAEEILKRMENGEIDVRFKDYSERPSVFANSIILAGVSDIVLMEDRSALFREIHMGILKKVLGENQGYIFTSEEINSYISEKFKIERKEDIPVFLRDVGAADILQQRGVNIFDHSDIPYDELREHALGLLKNGEIESVYADRVLFTVPEYVKYYSAVYSRDIIIDEKISKILNIINKTSFTDIWKSSGMRKDDVLEILKNLERAYMIKRIDVRAGEIFWDRRNVEKADINESRKFLILKILGYYGPITLSEIAYYINAREETVKEILKEMEYERKVISGQFLPGYETQYMLYEDYRKLRPDDIHDINKINNYRISNSLKKTDSIRDAFRKYIFFRSPFEASLRVRDFNMEEWVEMRKKNEILFGKFIGNSYVYVLKEYANLFRIYDIEYDDMIKNIISLLSSSTSISSEKLASILTVNQKVLQNYLNILERNAVISREFSEDEFIEPSDRFIYVGEEKSGENIFEKIIDSYGPITLNELSDLLSIDPNTLSKLIKSFSFSDVAGIRFYGKLNESNETVTAVIDSSDPVNVYIKNKILQKFPDTFNHFYIKDNEPEGALFSQFEYDILVIRDYSFTSEEKLLESINLLEKFYDNCYVLIEKRKNISLDGFKSRDRFLISREVNIGELNYDDILYYAAAKQGYFRYTTKRLPMDLEKQNMGLRSDVEIAEKCIQYISTERLKRSRVLYETRGIPDIITYVSEENAKLFQAIKNPIIGEDEKKIIDIVRDSFMPERNAIEYESILGKEKTSRIIDYLIDKSVFCLGPRDSLVYIESGLDRETAVKIFAEKFYEMFGFINIKRMYIFSKGYLFLHDVKNAVSYVKNKFSLEPFLLENMEIVYAKRENYYKATGKNGRKLKIFDPVIYNNFTYIVSKQDPFYILIRESVKKAGFENRSVVIRANMPVAGFNYKIKKNNFEINDLEILEGYDEIVKEILDRTASKMGMNLKVIP
ncbi:MAG: ATP-dependent helicase [Thermoplasmata archaeon]